MLLRRSPLAAIDGSGPPLPQRRQVVRGVSPHPGRRFPLQLVGLGAGAATDPSSFALRPGGAGSRPVLHRDIDDVFPWRPAPSC